MAVGTKFRLIWRICSPKPGIGFVATASVASGVTSRRDGPVPPVVRIRSQPVSSTSSISVAEIVAASSWISRVSTRQGELSAPVSNSCSDGMPLSSYTPCEARSLIDTKPITNSSGWLRFVAIVVFSFGEFDAFVFGFTFVQALVFLVFHARRGLDPLEQLAEVARRFRLFAFLAGVADQRAALLRVDAGMLADEVGEGGVVGEKFFAGAFNPVQLGRFRPVNAAI